MARPKGLTYTYGFIAVGGYGERNHICISYSDVRVAFCGKEWRRNSTAWKKVEWKNLAEAMGRGSINITCRKCIEILTGRESDE